MLKAPHEEYLLHSLTLLLGELEEVGVLVQRGISRTETRVTGAVDTLGGVVGYELRGWVVWVKLNLVDSWDDLCEINNE